MLLAYEQVTTRNGTPTLSSPSSSSYSSPASHVPPRLLPFSFLSSPPTYISPPPLLLSHSPLPTPSSFLFPSQLGRTFCIWSFHLCVFVCLCVSRYCAGDILKMVGLNICSSSPTFFSLSSLPPLHPYFLISEQ